MAQNGSYIVINGKTYIAKPRDYVARVDHDAVAGSVVSVALQIDSSSAFILQSRHMDDTNDPSTGAPGLYGQYESLVQIQDTSNGYLWSNDFEPRSAFSNWRGSGFPLPTQVMIDMNTQLQVRIQNPAVGASAGTAWVILRGLSIYPA